MVIENPKDQRKSIKENVERRNTGAERKVAEQ